METNARFPQFFPERLIEAREARGLTLSQLAEQINLTHQAISKYEKGQTIPGFDILDRLSNSLNVPITFFYKEPSPSTDSVVYFRSLTMATQKSKKVHYRKIGWIRDIHHYLERFLDFPELKVPRYITRDSYFPTSFEEIDDIALQVRRYWNLGNGPISNVTLLLEKAGIIISRPPFSSFTIDACSKWEENGRPYVLLSSDKTAVRSRFDVAHELGHLVLHSNIRQSDFNNREYYKLMEKEAHRFAGAFLLPAPSFGTEVISASLNHLISLKDRWKVSIQAIAYRAMSLGLLSEHQHIYLRQRMAKENLLTKEPLDDTLPFEEPVAIKQAIEALVDHNIKTKQDIVNEISLHGEEIESYANLNFGYFFPQETRNVVSINLRK